MGPRGAEGAAREVVLLGVDLHLVPGLVVVEVPDLEDHRQRLFALREAVPEPRAEELSQLFLPPLGGGQHPRQVPVPMRALAFGRLLPDLPLDLRRVGRRSLPQDPRQVADFHLRLRGLEQSLPNHLLLLLLSRLPPLLPHLLLLLLRQAQALGAQILAPQARGARRTASPS